MGGFVMKARAAVLVVAGLVAASSFAQDLRWTEGGETYELENGDLYRLEYLQAVYPPDWRDEYSVDAMGQRWRTVDGTAYPVADAFASTFDPPLIDPAAWFGTTTTSAQNSVEVVNMPAPCGGGLTLRAHAQPDPGSPSKASLQRELLWYTEGDTVRIAAEFYVEADDLTNGGGTTFLDLESTHWYSYTGLRTIIKNGALAIELEVPKTTWSQPNPVPFPVGQWVGVLIEIGLSAELGAVRYWQDGALLINDVGRTLPIADFALDRLEVGVTAIAQGAPEPVTVWMRSVSIERVVP